MVLYYENVVYLGLIDRDLKAHSTRPVSNGSLEGKTRTVTKMKKI